MHSVYKLMRILKIWKLSKARGQGTRNRSMTWSDLPLKPRSILIVSKGLDYHHYKRHSVLIFLCFNLTHPSLYKPLSTLFMIFLINSLLYFATKVDLASRPHPRGGKGYDLHWTFSWAWWHFISEFSCTNQIHAMWYICDYHVTLHYSRILHVCVAMPKRCVVILHPVAQDIIRCRPDSFPP